MIRAIAVMVLLTITGVLHAQLASRVNVWAGGGAAFSTVRGNDLIDNRGYLISNQYHLLAGYAVKPWLQLRGGVGFVQKGSQASQVGQDAQGNPTTLLDREYMNYLTLPGEFSVQPIRTFPIWVQAGIWHNWLLSARRVSEFDGGNATDTDITETFHPTDYGWSAGLSYVHAFKPHISLELFAKWAEGALNLNTKPSINNGPMRTRSFQIGVRLGMGAERETGR